MAHPEEPASADAAAAENASKAEDEAVKKQLMATLGTDEVPKLEVTLQPVAVLEPTTNGIRTCDIALYCCADISSALSSVLPYIACGVTAPCRSHHQCLRIFLYKCHAQHAELLFLLL